MGITAGGMIILLAISGGLPEIMWLGNGGMAGSAASAGMGGTWYTDSSPQGALENPVMASRLPLGITAGATGATVLDIEKRTRRVYDSFGGVVGEAEYAYNQNFTPLPGGIAVSMSTGALAASAGWRAVSTFSYDYRRVINDNSYIMVADETLSIRGMLSEFSLAGSYTAGDMFSFGAGGGYLTGTRDSEYLMDYEDPTAPDISLDTETDISGMIARGSVLADLGRVEVTAGIEQPIDWKYTVENYETELTLPMKVRSGFLYNPGNRLKSLFTADLWWSGTSSVEVAGEETDLRNSWGIGAGVQNTLPGSAMVRTGFSYESSPLSSALDRMAFTAGIGWVLGDVSLDAALAFSPVRWDQYQADGLPTFVYGDSLVMESSRTAFSLGVTKTF